MTEEEEQAMALPNIPFVHIEALEGGWLVSMPEPGERHMASRRIIMSSAKDLVDSIRKWAERHHVGDGT